MAASGTASPSPIRSPGHLLFLLEPQGKAALPALPSRSFGCTWLISGGSCQHAWGHGPMSHTQPLQQDYPHRYARAPTHAHKASSALFLGPATPPAGLAQRKPPVPLPSMCFSVPLSDARSVPAGPPCMLPSHRATVQQAFSFSFSTPLPNTQKRVIKWVCLFFFFLYRNKKLAFLPFCFPSLGLNLANGK